MSDFGSNTEIVDFEFDSDLNQIEIIYRERSNKMLDTNPPQKAPDRVWKETYKVNDVGKIHLANLQNGIHTPVSIIPEKIEFDK